jgi:multiple sugar transport system permease protein
MTLLAPSGVGGSSLQEGSRHSRRRPYWLRKQALTGYLFVAPWVIGMIVFYLGPILVSFYYSLTDYSIISEPTFVGLDNYSRMLGDQSFRESIKVTLIYTVISLFLYVVVAFFIALLANSKVRGVGTLRLLVFLPSLIPLFAAAVLWGWLFNADFGLVNFLLEAAGIPRQGFFQSPSQALPLTALISFWTIGSAFLVYLSGLQSVPTHLYEAITIDGGGALRRFWHVTLPMTSPVILFNLIIGIVLSFQVFDIAYVLTKGGPADSTLFWVLLIWRRAFEDFSMGYASALAWVLFLTVIAITGILFRTSRWWVHYEGVKR